MEYDITVQEAKSLPDGIYRVAVVNKDDGEVISEHTVRVEAMYVEKIGWKLERICELIRVSFLFLLEREAPSNILKEFNLQLITQYFPEYEEAMRTY